MKKRGLLASAAAILMAVGAHALMAGGAHAAGPDAAPTVSGFVGIYGGGTFFSSDDEDDSVEGVAGAEAAVNLWLSPMFSAQVDAQGEGTTHFDDSDFDDDNRSNYTVTGHLTYRNPSSYAIGLFGGFTHNEIVDEDYMQRWVGGIEGQLYLDDVTLYFQTGYSVLKGGSEDHSEPIDVLPYLRGVARWFPTDYDKIQPEFAWFYAYNVDRESTNDQGPVEYLDWGLLYEHLFKSAPVSAFVKYAGLSYDDDSHDNAAFYEHMGLIGFRLYLNQKDLKFNDRFGATLDSHTWRGMSWTEEGH